MAKVAVIKTTQNDSDIRAYLDGITDAGKREDSYQLVEVMSSLSGEEPKMWGKSIIGFGKVRYKSPASGREVDWFKIGFSPRKANISIHLVGDVKKQTELLGKLGKHKTGVGCLYIQKLADVDMKVLKQLIKESLKAKS